MALSGMKTYGISGNRQARGPNSRFFCDMRPTASFLFAGACFRFRHGSFALLRLVVVDRRPDELFQRRGIDLVAFEEVDGAPLIAVKTRVEKLVGIGKL